MIQELNKIVHPLIYEELEKRINSLQKERMKHRFCVVEVPLLFESGAIFDFSIYVYAPLEVRYERVKSRNGMTRKKFDFIVKNQIDPEVARNMADFVIENSGNIDELLNKIKRLVEFLDSKGKRALS